MYTIRLSPVHYSTESGTLFDRVRYIGLSLCVIFRERTPFVVMLDYLGKGYAVGLTAPYDSTQEYLPNITEYIS